MKCLYCNDELPQAAAFCPTCGSPIVGEEPSLADPATAKRRNRRRLRDACAIVGSLVLAAAVVGTVAGLVYVQYRRSEQKNALS